MSTATLPRPAERVAIFSLVLVFLCGAAAGAVAMSVWGHRGFHGEPTGGVISLTPSVKEWRERLDLNDDQTRKLTSVLDDFSRYYDNVLADGNSRIMQILTPAQKAKFERMIQDHRK